MGDQPATEAPPKGRLSAQLAVWVPLKPRVKGNTKAVMRNKATGRPFVKGSKAEEKHEQLLRAALKSAWRSPELLAVPVRVDVVVVLPMPQLSPERPPTWRVRARQGLELPVAPVDGDRGNYLKMVEDALEGSVLENDALVVDGRCAKIYGDEPGYEIRVTPIAGRVLRMRRAKHG